MGYIFTKIQGATKIESDDGRLLVSTNSAVKLTRHNETRFRIMQADGLGQLLDIDVSEIISISGSPPSGSADQVFDQLIAVFPDASSAAGAITSINGQTPDENGNIEITAADIGIEPANPSVLVGTTVKNGSAPTFMRSDAAPALDQAIAPSWTGVHQWPGPNGAAATIRGNQISVSKGLGGLLTNGAASALIVHGIGGGYDGAIGLNGQSGLNDWCEIAAQGGNGITFRFTNNATTLGSFQAISWLAAQGNFTSGITGITSDSGSGAWAHTGNVTVSGTLNVGGAQVGGVVASDGRNAQAANINSPTFYAVPVSGMYRVSAFLVQSQAATTSSTLPSSSTSYTEATTGVAVQDLISLSANTNQVGLHASGSIIINAQQGSNIGYVTNEYASSGATPMQYSIHIKIEFLG